MSLEEFCIGFEEAGSKWLSRIIGTPLKVITAPVWWPIKKAWGLTQDGSENWGSWQGLEMFMQFPGARTKEMATNAYYNIRNGLKAGRDKTVSRHKQRKWKIQSKIQSTIARLTGRDQKVNQFLHGALALQLENQKKEQLNKLYEVFSKRKTQLNK